MSRPRFVFAVVIIFVITTRQYYYVVATSSSSSSSSIGPKSIANKSLESAPSSNNSPNQQPPKKNASQRQPSSQVTFLYELYEHEIYNPNTDSWTSRLFTQSRESGGGGRDYQSLDPQTCSPPRGTMVRWGIVAFV